MKYSGRYDRSGLTEGQLEPGLRGRVLRNLVGIKSKREMDRIEGKKFVHIFKKHISVYDAKHKFSANDICGMHKEWLDLNRNYAPMEKIFDEVIERALHLHGRSSRAGSSLHEGLWRQTWERPQSPTMLRYSERSSSLAQQDLSNNDLFLQDFPLSWSYSIRVPYCYQRGK